MENKANEYIFWTKFKVKFYMYSMYIFSFSSFGNLPKITEQTVHLVFIDLSKFDYEAPTLLIVVQLRIIPSNRKDILSLLEK